MDTIVSPAPRARRRKHSAQFKAELIAQCSQPGVSIASIALRNGLNANLLRRWITEHEQGQLRSAASVLEQHSGVVEGEFVALKLPPTTHSSGAETSITIELVIGASPVTIRWPLAHAAASAAWLRQLLS